MHQIADVNNKDGRPLGLCQRQFDRRLLWNFPNLPTFQGPSTASGLGTGLLSRSQLAMTDWERMYTKPD